REAAAGGHPDSVHPKIAPLVGSRVPDGPPRWKADPGRERVYQYRSFRDPDFTRVISQIVVWSQFAAT
ncbi:MAG: hypothetical protein ABSG32_31155, partial [Terriglobia bacterium]